MIAEAVDAALLVADALAVWVLVLAVVGTCVVYAVVVGGWLIWRGMRRTVSAAIPRRGPWRPSGAAEPPRRSLPTPGVLPTP